MIRGAAFVVSILLLASGSARAERFVCSFISLVSPGPEVMIQTYTLDNNVLVQSSPVVKFTVVQNTAEGIVGIYPDPEMRFSMVMMINRQTGSFTLSTAPGAPIAQSNRIDGKCNIPYG